MNYLTHPTTAECPSPSPPVRAGDATHATPTVPSIAPTPVPPQAPTADLKVPTPPQSASTRRKRSKSPPTAPPTKRILPKASSITSYFLPDPTTDPTTITVTSSDSAPIVPRPSTTKPHPRTSKKTMTKTNKRSALPTKINSFFASVPPPHSPCPPVQTSTEPKRRSQPIPRLRQSPRTRTRPHIQQQPLQLDHFGHCLLPTLTSNP
jgi:hypothetical protein